jgi:hypothetical protein
MSISSTSWHFRPAFDEHRIRALLDSFLLSAFDLTDAKRLDAIEQLQARHRALAFSRAQRAEVWTAWITPKGTWLAVGRLDVEQSVAVRAPVLWIEWVEPAGKRCRGWWHSYLPNEWIAGRGNP